MNTLRPTPDCPDKGFITYYNIRFLFRPPGNAFKHLYRISKRTGAAPFENSQVRVL